MNFYSLSGMNSEYSLHILELNKLKFLLVRNFCQDRMLRYLPSFEHHQLPHEIDEFSALKKKLKVDPLTRRTSNGYTNSSSSTAKTSAANPFYTTINSAHYIRNSSMRFDLTYLNNLDFNSIDFILLTSIDDLFLLPFLCHSPKMKARVFSTTPVAQIGQHAILEFYRLVCERNRHVESLEHAYFAETEFFDVFERDYDLEINQWVDIFSVEDITRAFSRIETMNYHQKLSLEGADIAIQPFPSGYSIGSCLWQLDHARNTIMLCNNIAAPQSNHRHPMQLVPAAHLASQVDFFFLSSCINTSKPTVPGAISIASSTSAHQTQSELTLLAFIHKTQDLLAQKKQNVVIPIRDGAIFLDMLDILERKFGSFVRHFYVICQSAHPFISLGNANVDYLHEKLQKKIYTDQPSNPFSAYESLLKTQLLSVYDDFIQFAQSNKFLTLQAMIQAHTPSIYFIVDSTLRLGNTMQLLKLIDEATPKTEEVSSNIVLVDPQMQSQEIIAPVMGRFRNHVYYLPIDNRMHVNEFTDYIAQVNPKNLIYPRKYQEIQMHIDAKRNDKSHSTAAMTPVVYGNDEAVALNLYYRGSGDEYVFDREDTMNRVRYYVGDPKVFPKLSGKIGIMAGRFDPVMKKITALSANAADLEDKKMILMRRKDADRRKKDLQDTVAACSAHMKRTGYYLLREETMVPASSMIGVDGDFKLVFKHPTTQDTVVIQHYANTTQVYASQKAMINDVTQAVKQNLLLLELAAE